MNCAKCGAEGAKLRPLVYTHGLRRPPEFSGVELCDRHQGEMVDLFKAGTLDFAAWIGEPMPKVSRPGGEGPVPDQFYSGQIGRVVGLDRPEEASLYERAGVALARAVSIETGLHRISQNLSFNVDSPPEMVNATGHESFNLAQIIHLTEDTLKHAEATLGLITRALGGPQ